jgi:hypothetical protein
MNAYITNNNPYSLNANYAYNPSVRFANPSPAFTNGNQNLVSQGPVDSVMLSGDAAYGNFNFGTTDICDCQFGNYAAQDAFIVPAGDQDNPYQNYNATAMELPVANGQNPQQALLALLEALGFTPEMLQALQAMGINLLDLVAAANGMESLSGLQHGQELVLPTTIPANSEIPVPVYIPTSSGGPSQPASTPSTPAAAEAPAPTPAPAPAPRPRLTPGREDAHSRMGANGGRGPNPNPPRTSGGGGGGRVLVM